MHRGLPVIVTAMSAHRIVRNRRGHRGRRRCAELGQAIERLMRTDTRWEMVKERAISGHWQLGGVAARMETFYASLRRSGVTLLAQVTPLIITYDSAQYSAPLDKLAWARRSW